MTTSPCACGAPVHHKNGEKDDNSLENLELWTGSHPRGQRVIDKLEWAIEFIERYTKEEGALFESQDSDRRLPIREKEREINP